MKDPKPGSETTRDPATPKPDARALLIRLAEMIAVVKYQRASLKRKEEKAA